MSVTHEIIKNGGPMWPNMSSSVRHSSHLLSPLSLSPSSPGDNKGDEGVAAS